VRQSEHSIRPPLACLAPVSPDFILPLVVFPCCSDFRSELLLSAECRWFWRACPISQVDYPAHAAGLPTILFRSVFSSVHKPNSVACSGFPLVVFLPERCHRAASSLCLCEDFCRPGSSWISFRSGLCSACEHGIDLCSSAVQSVPCPSLPPFSSKEHAVSSRVHRSLIRFCRQHSSSTGRRSAPVATKIFVFCTGAADPFSCSYFSRQAVFLRFRFGSLLLIH
jgi:hypothetical protein